MANVDVVQELTEIANSGLPFTDMLIEQDAPLMLKMPGGWQTLEGFDPLGAEQMGELLLSIDPEWENNITQGSISRPLELSQWRLRINAYLAFGGNKVMMSIRRIPKTPLALKDTGLPSGVRLLLDAPHGIILVAGATGSGKSSTMAAMVDAINEARNAHIITIEDPIEYVFEKKKAVFSQREIGVDVGSFFEGVRDAMRQRPDVIVVGEIRDRDTAETALLAGESGHLVIGTLHASSTSGAIQKLLSFFPAQDRDAKVQSLAGSLVGVISQILLPNTVRTGYSLAAELLANHKQQFSRVLNDPNALQAALERREDGVSRTIADSLVELVSDQKVLRADAIRSLSGNSSLYERLKNL